MEATRNPARLCKRLTIWANALERSAKVYDIGALGEEFLACGFKPPRWAASGSFRGCARLMDEWCDRRGIKRRGSYEDCQPFLARLVRFCVSRLEGQR